ncbi:MAG: HAD family hydrolase [Gaiellaceae bacterium]
MTLDAFGTLVELVDPVPPLQAALAKRGIERSAEEVGAAFRAEVEHYVPRSHLGPLDRLRCECVGVFLRAADARLDVEEFVAPFVEALVFRPLPGVVEALARLRARGLALAVVSNWDESLREKLPPLGIDVVVSSAEVGAPKPDPAIFRVALERLGVTASRALHIGDSASDEAGARAAGMRFRWAPL